MNRNNTKIFSFISDRTKEYNIEYEKEQNKLRRHQYIINKFFNNIQFEHIKGMLFYHSMGSGKTITSISIALEFIKNFKEKVIIMANKSLHQNYIFDIKKFLSFNNNNYSEESINNIIDKDFIFISMNASNIISKFKAINIKNKLLIIDEAHNMFNSVVNGSQNMTEIYNIIRNENNLKLILLSGTPIVNTPYESVICFNLLINNKYKILPENYADFLNYFIDIDNDELYKLRLDKLGNRIVGLISHYENEINEDFPKNLGIDVIKCPMTKTQSEQYFIFKNMELEKQSNYFSKNRGKNIGIAKNNKGSIGDYKIKTRMLSNILPQDDVINCIKFNKIYDNINNINNGKNISLIYSQFTNDFGIASLEKYLLKKNMLCLNKEFNITHLNENDFFNNNNNIENKSIVENILKKKYFAIISGTVDFEDRQKIQNLINNPKNKYGEFISIVIVSSTGAEGLNFSNLRSIHILESYWNYSRILQIQARGIRYLSHKELKSDEQNVKTFIYLSHLTNDVKTTDEEIYELAINNYDLINDFLNLYKKYSIDCDFHFKENCAKCNVDSKSLFNDNFEIDINISNPCHANIQTEIGVIHVENNIYKDKKGKFYKLINDELIPL